MNYPEIPLNVGKNSAADVKQTHYDLERTQPADQIEEGRKWDRKVAKAANGGSSGSSKKG